MAEALRVSPTLTLPGHLLEFAYTLSGGKGGQHAQKNDTKVQLRFDLERCDVLSEAVKGRLRRATTSLLTKEGVLVISSDRYRSRKRNVDDVRTKLVALIQSALIAPRVRKDTKPSRSQRERRMEAKRRQSQRKESRRKVTPP